MKNDELEITDEQKPKIEDGTYRVAYVRHSKAKYYGEKLYVYFRVLNEGPNFEIELFRAYNFYSPLRRTSDLYRDLAKLKGCLVPKNSKLSVNLFKNKVLLVRVRTVSQDRKQAPLPEYEKYSVIDQIIGVEK